MADNNDNDHTTSVPPANDNSKMTEKTDQNEKYSLRVKKEFILTERDPSLPALPKPEEQQDSGRDGNNNKNKKPKKRKRCRDVRAPPSEKMCSSVLHNEECRYKDSCRFSHDLDKYMKNRPPDIDIPGMTCPHYSTYGHCTFGVACRLGSVHIDKNGKNVDKETVIQPPPVLNGIRKEIQFQLRKKTYPFKRQRHKDIMKTPGADDPKPAAEGETGVEVNNDMEEKERTPPPASSTAASTSYEPLPTKERKLIDFSNKVYVAPLTTVGNLPFRRIMKHYGADITCGEMALCSQLLEGKASEWALLKRHACEDVFGVQLAAGYPDLYTRACELIEAETTVDFVDMNLGCPIDLVCKKGAGASMMLREKRFRDSLIGITQTLSCAVTVKMRTGWIEGKPLAHAIVPKIVSKWGLPPQTVSAAMIHGRSRLQRYSNLADWDYIKKVANECSSAVCQNEGPGNNNDNSCSPIPIIGNGDIFSYVDYERKVMERPELSSCAMLARAALIKPWLPTEIKERRHWDISATERLDMLKDFVRFGLEHWGSDQQGVNNCRRFLLEWLSFLHRYIPGKYSMHPMKWPAKKMLRNDRMITNTLSFIEPTQLG